MFNGQAQQDKFVLNLLNFKKNGFFIEIGSNDPISINNTFILEKNYNWNGIMIEYDPRYLDLYKIHRQNSIHIINDARNINYKELFINNNVPNNIDYLQIDLEVDNRSTLTTLELLDNQVLDTYKFATITFEHDIYRGNFFDTKFISRNIFKNRGYIPIFTNINNGGINSFEDWYIHPDLVNMDHVNKIIEKNVNNYKFDKNILENSINWQDIIY